MVHRVLVSPHPDQHFSFPVFSIVAVLTGVKRYLIVLICISLMIGDVEHLFIYLPAIYISSLLFGFLMVLLAV